MVCVEEGKEEMGKKWDEKHTKIKCEMWVMEEMKEEREKETMWDKG